MIDSILTASDDKNWKVRVRQTLKSLLLQFPQISSTKKERKKKGLIIHVVSSKFAMGGDKVGAA